MKAAFLFPGQGSQKVGMGQDINNNFAESRTLFEAANNILGYDLAKLCFEGPEEQLKQTVYTQPALYVTSCAALSALRSRVNIEPFAVAGHSIGEYAALFAAGAMKFDTGLSLVCKRAELMQAAAAKSPGAMVAVLGIDADVADACCADAKAEVGGVAVVANYNCPGQIILSGTVEAVTRAGELAKERGAKRAMPLAVSGAFHSPLMAAAGDELYASLRAALFQQAKIPVVTNVNAEFSKSGADFAPLLTMQVSGSVRWEESMRLLLAEGVTRFIELGSGDVLAGLMKRIDKSVRVVSVQDSESLEAAVALLTEPEEPTVAVEAGPDRLIYHIVKREVWDAASARGEYRSESLATEGFIHCSRIGQVAETGNRHYRARAGLTLLEIDTSKLSVEVKFEGAENAETFPHIYGPLPLSAVVRVIDFPAGPDGRFKLPNELSN
ncbi:MAG: ACP S-malonyltransferase [Chthonomonadales bacterium]